MLCGVFMDSKLFIGYVSGAIYIQKILEIRHRRSLVAQAMSSRRAFDMQLYFRAVMFLLEFMGTKLLSTVRHYNIGTRLGYAVQVKMKAWKACTWAAGLGSIKIAL